MKDRGSKRLDDLTDSCALKECKRAPEFISATPAILSLDHNYDLVMALFLIWKYAWVTKYPLFILQMEGSQNKKENIPIKTVTEPSLCSLTMQLSNIEIDILGPVVT